MKQEPKVYVVIGRGYGDEGKGLVTDFLASKNTSTLVVRHNGGAQSGHTVEVDDKRFIFHELSSGSVRKSDTFWAFTYLPDVYKLSEEISEFESVFGFVPNVYADVNTNVTVIDDVLINMAIETHRGDMRHGSCGMGINEADLRIKAGFTLSIGELFDLSTEEIFNRLKTIRENYLPVRLNELGLSSSDLGEYTELLSSDSVLINVASVMKENIRYVTPVKDYASFFMNYAFIVFESGQGLLLDADCEESLPNVTASKTGLTNPVKILDGTALKINEVCYVMRSFVTKHGAGNFTGECKPSDIGDIECDATNIHNDWQGSIRYGKYLSVEDLVKPLKSDLKQLSYDVDISLFVTHLNETNGAVSFTDENMPLDDFVSTPEIKLMFNKIYKSYTHFSKDIEIHE